jgi:hypothetical protein
LDQEIVLVHVGTNRIFELNESGAKVWRLLDEGCDVDEIVRRLTEEFDVDETQAADEVKNLVAQLWAERLLAP